MILAGRVERGGVHLALFRPAVPEPHLLRSVSLPADGHDSLRSILRRFVSEDLPALRSACLAVPGPVIQGSFDSPELPWPVRTVDIAAALGLPAAELVDAASLPEASLLSLARRASAGDG